MVYQLESLVKTAIGIGMLGSMEIAYVSSKPDQWAPYMAGAIILSGLLARYDIEKSFENKGKIVQQE